jgi:hypothetical protein
VTGIWIASRTTCKSLSCIQTWTLVAMASINHKMYFNKKLPFGTTLKIYVQELALHARNVMTCTSSFMGKRLGCSKGGVGTLPKSCETFKSAGSRLGLLLLVVVLGQPSVGQSLGILFQGVWRCFQICSSILCFTMLSDARSTRSPPSCVE